MSFENLLTLKCGSLIPLLCEEMMPNETVKLGHLSQIQLPPMATNFFGRVDFRIEAFFVPMRILWGGWQNFFTMPFNNPFSQSVLRSTQVPSVQFNNEDYTIDSDLVTARGSLADYLGFKFGFGVGGDSKPIYLLNNVLPFFAYHKIFDDWYRNKLIQQPVFVNNNSAYICSRLPWYNSNTNVVFGSGSGGTAVFNDGVSLFSLRQRNWAKDYFTTAALYPQGSGDVVGSSVEFDVASNKGEISIPALRNANVLQRWMDRNNIAGYEYADQIKAHYGRTPSDAIMQRPVFLGSDIVGVYNRSVYSNSYNVPDSITAGAQPRNPYAKYVGSNAASAQGFKDGNLVNNFTTSEHGYLMVLGSLVPHRYYSTGIRRQLQHCVRGDFPIPLLQGLGEQPIYDSELSGTAQTTLQNRSIFGYQQQYAENKYHDDEVHGLLVDGEDLAAFSLQSGFETAPDLGTEFIQIPQDYLDQVQVVNTSTSGFSAWADIYFNFKKISPLSEYVIPTLGDLKHTRKSSVPYRGRML